MPTAPCGLWLRLLRSHIRFCETDEPETETSLVFGFHCLTSCPTELAESGEAQRRRWPMRRAAEAESG
jgi:hypothetical protein